MALKTIKPRTGERIKNSSLLLYRDIDEPPLSVDLAHPAGPVADVVAVDRLGRAARVIAVERRAGKLACQRRGLRNGLPSSGSGRCIPSRSRDARDPWNRSDPCPWRTGLAFWARILFSLPLWLMTARAAAWPWSPGSWLGLQVGTVRQFLLGNLLHSTTRLPVGRWGDLNVARLPDEPAGRRVIVTSPGCHTNREGTSHASSDRTQP